MSNAKISTTMLADKLAVLHTKCKNLNTFYSIDCYDGAEQFITTRINTTPSITVRVPEKDRLESEYWAARYAIERINEQEFRPTRRNDD